MEVSNDSNESIELPLDTRNDVIMSFQGINGTDQQMVIGREENVLDHAYLPSVSITEQPQARGFRFRYECEGPSHGGLQGSKSERSRKTYPSIKIDNYRKSARVEVSLVTVDDEPKNHPHKLVGKNCNDGICVVDIKEANSVIPFQNMSVQHVTKKKSQEVLLKRIKNEMILEKKILAQNLNANVSLSGKEEELAEKQAKEQAKSTQLNAVRLRFRVYIADNNTGQCIIPLDPVYSSPIYDSKSPGAATLKICRMDKYGGCCTGNEEVFLLCEKVQKDDILVRFIETDGDGKVIWEEYGNFGPLDVHRQFAIVFRTPAYRDTNIDRAVNVFIVLQRKSDQEQSDPKSFTYFPQNLDKDEIMKKKRKKIPLNNPYSEFRDGLDGGNGGDTDRNYGGDGGGQSNRTPLSNGANMMTHNSTVPFSAIQAARECYDSNPNSPYSPYFNEYSSDVMYGYNDLTTDSEPVHPNDLIFAEDYKHIDDVDGMMSKMKISDNIQKQTGLHEVSATSMTPQHKTFLSTTTKIPDIETQSENETPSVKNFVEKAVETEPIRSAPNTEAVKIIERTVSAMQDYAETSDIRYLLIVQRHLASVQNANGDLPIHLAVINEQLPALQSLLGVMATLPNCYVKVNSFNYIRQTPLHLSVLTNQPEAIELLLHHGADPAIMDRAGNTAANLAVQYNSTKCLKALLKYLRPGVSAKFPFPELNYMNYEGYCPAHIAAQRGNVEMLRLLHHGHASLDLPDGKSGRTPLHHSVENDDLSVASFLLMEVETDVNVQCFDGNTPLHIACGRNLVGMTALLVTAGADVTIENEELYDEGYGSESGERGDYKDGEKRGMRPADYVKDNDKILKVLHGDSPAEDLDVDGDENTVLSLTESGLGSFTPITTKGDIERLKFAQRMELSQILDPPSAGKDIISLTELLGFSHLINALEGIKSTTTSPTRFLLDYYETSEGTLEKLKSCLEKMGRQDAVKIIASVINK